MFGFSLFKILFTIAIVIVVWNGFKYFNRVQEQRGAKTRVKTKKTGSNTGPSASPAQDGIEDMVQCKACGAYVTRGAKPCGKDECPFSG